MHAGVSVPCSGKWVEVTLQCLYWILAARRRLRDWRGVLFACVIRGTTSLELSKAGCHMKPRG